MKSPLLAGFVALLCVGGLIHPAWAVKGESWDHHEPGDFDAAELENVVVTSLGEVTLGRKVETLLVLGSDAEVVNALAKAGDGRLYAATGPKGLIYRIDGEKVSEFAKLPGGATVFSLLFTQDGKLLAGTGGGPQARIYLIDGGGQSTVFFEPPGARYVWAMARGADGRIYAATGIDGKLFAIEPAGKTGKVVVDLKPKNLLCLAFGSEGSLYCGTDEDGLVYRVNPTTGKSYVMYDAKESEVSALTLDAAGNLFVATAGADGARPGRSVADSPGGKPETPATRPSGSQPADAQSGPAKGKAAKSPTTTKASKEDAAEEDAADEDQQKALLQALGLPKQMAKPSGGSSKGADGGNAIYRIDVDGFVSEVFREPVMILALAEDEGDVFAATGNEGRIYSVNPKDERTTMLARLKADQATAMMLLPHKELVLGTANPAMLVRMSNGYAPEGKMTSKPLDAEQIVKWGRVQWKATVPEGTKLSVATRSGNVGDEESDAWEEWSAEMDATSPQQIISAGARFLQYRVTFASSKPDATPTLRKLELFRIEENRRPIINDLKVLLLSEAAKEPSTPAKIKGLAAGGGSGDGEDEPKPDTMAVIMWKTEDPNEDTLRYEVFYREQGSQRWIRVEKDLKETYLLWNTLTVPDGRYEVRIMASDILSNAPGVELSAARVSDPLVVDNTPPVATISEVTFEGKNRVVINANFSDELSNIREAAYTLDSDDEWIPLAAADDVFDSPQESVTFAINNLAAGEHRIAIRVRDSQSNTRYVTRAITVGE